MEIKKSTFFPTCNLDEKSNYKIYNRIERDGTVFERILLDVPDPTLRESLICVHYLKNYVKVFYKKPLGFNIISRDNPWDFKIEFSSKEICNVEITSIADDVTVFEKMKREERFVSNTFNKKISLFELIKINSFFPNPYITETIKGYQDANLSKKEHVENPYYGVNHRLFLSNTSEEQVPLQNLLLEAIEKKVSKSHPEKENTILLIDNRTIIYDIPDLYSAAEGLSEFFANTPFKEIWFYTGYCSDLDGNNAEFSLMPLKLPDSHWKILEKFSNENKPDKNGIFYI